jgi:hypothetical protein
VRCRSSTGRADGSQRASMTGAIVTRVKATPDLPSEVKALVKMFRWTYVTKNEPTFERVWEPNQSNDNRLLPIVAVSLTSIDPPRSKEVSNKSKYLIQAVVKVGVRQGETDL